jgi:type IV secretory pathway VirJ component
MPPCLTRACLHFLHKGPLMLAAAWVSASVLAAPAVDLPLVLNAPRVPGSALAVFVSGDGGWADIDEDVTEVLLGAGYGVVGIDASHYFRDAKTPERFAADVAAVAAQYSEAWQRDELLLVGYSRGADLMPFAATRLDDALAARVRAVVLIAPAIYTSFKFHLADLWSNPRRSDSVDTLPETQKVRQRIICFYGSDEEDSLCPLLAGNPAHNVIRLSGGHHFDGDYTGLGQRLLRLLDTRD